MADELILKIGFDLEAGVFVLYVNCICNKALVSAKNVSAAETFCSKIALNVPRFSKDDNNWLADKRKNKP